MVLVAVGQRLEPDGAVLAYWVVESDRWCRRCGCRVLCPTAPDKGNAGLVGLVSYEALEKLPTSSENARSAGMATFHGSWPTVTRSRSTAGSEYDSLRDLKWAGWLDSSGGPPGKGCINQTAPLGSEVLLVLKPYASTGPKPSTPSRRT